MQIQLPKWMIKELEKRLNRSAQYIIKEILKEYLDSEDGGRIRKRIREREGVLN